MTRITPEEARAAVGGIDFILGLLGIRVEKGGKAKTIYTPEEILGMEEGLAQPLKKMAAKVNTPLRKSLYGLMTKKDWSDLSEKEREAIYQLAAGKLADAGAEMGEMAAPVIRREAERVYTEVREVLSGKLGISADFEAIDQKLIDTFARDNNYWIGKHYTEEHLEAVKRIGARALEEGLGRDELADLFKDALGSQFEDYRYWDVLSSTVINRSRTYSTVRSMHLIGIKEYVWMAVNDERTCPICGELDGQVFKTERIYEIIEETASLENPEDLKTTTPWLSVDPEGEIYYKDAAGERRVVDIHNVEELQNAGMGFPPIHGNSYDKETEIYTADGWKPVSEARIGDKCLSLNPKDFSLEYVPVIKTYEHFADGMIHFQNRAGDLDLMVTPDHNVFWQPDTGIISYAEWGFIKARELLNKRSGRMYRGEDENPRWKDYIYLEDMDIAAVEYNDTAFCVDLAKFHTLLTRRNGKVVWSGNCRCDIVIADQ